MSALGFFVDFAVNGHIQGVSLNSTPEEWIESLGTDFVDDKSKKNKRMRRDYGLIELGFFRVDGSWSCFLISLQVHRLWQNDGNVPRKLVDQYGEFPKQVQFQELHIALRALGFDPQLIADEHSSDIARYHIPGANVLIGVVAKAAEEPNSIPAGAVWAMHLSANSEVWARPPSG
jgi:hypothetical protein